MASPSDFRPQLTDARLRVIAEALLDVMYDTQLVLDSVLDDGYTRGTTTFGRQRNAIIALCQSGKYPWLKLTHAAMDVTFEIEGIPCRFFADDPTNPKKRGFWRRNQCDRYLFEPEAGQPQVFRFIVDKGQGDNSDPDIFFVGFDTDQVAVFEWQFTRSTPVLAAVDESMPKEVPIPAPVLQFPIKKQPQRDQAVGDDVNDTQG